jgi:hypothetical protein
MEHTYLAKVKGADPETFVFITMHEDYSGPKKTAFMTEPELREFFRVNGRPDLKQLEIDSCIEDARNRLV